MIVRLTLDVVAVLVLALCWAVIAVPTIRLRRTRRLARVALGHVVDFLSYGLMFVAIVSALPAGLLAALSTRMDRLAQDLWSVR